MADSFQSEQQDAYGVLGELNTRLRILESRYNLVRERMFMINQNMIDEYKKLMQEIRELNDDMKELRNQVFEMKDMMKDLVKEMEFFARKEDLKVLEKYINMWNPLKFVTEQDVIDIIHKTKKRGKKK